MEQVGLNIIGNRVGGLLKWGLGRPFEEVLKGSSISLEGGSGILVEDKLAKGRRDCGAANRGSGNLV